MFGMEKKEEKKTVFLFDLEKALTKEEYRTELSKRLQTRIIRLRDLLHSGTKKEEFENLGILLNGYHALAIVLARASQETKKKEK
jgi:hypothetical protein